MFSQISDFVHRNSLLPPVQSGFRTGHSCETALLKVTDDIITSTDRGLVTVLTLLDFTKAFDTVHHDGLVGTLRAAGFSANSLELVAGFLHDRKQSVRLDNAVSAPLCLSQGVPQGSILSPLLFSLYTRNIPACIEHSSMHMYADDIQLYKSFKPKDWFSAVADLNSDLDSILKLSKQLNLNVNPSKSQVILFGSAKICMELRRVLVVRVDGSALPVVEGVRNLGLTMDNTFRFREQISRCIKNSYLTMKTLYPHRSTLSARTKVRLCESLILSRFAYCSVVYGPAIDANTEYRIQKVQNSCLRYIFGIRKFDHVSHKLKDCGWLDMRRRRELRALCLFHRIMAARTPPYLYDKITFRTDVHNITTRHRNLISPPPHKTSLFERSFSFNIYTKYNSLSSTLKSLSPGLFKQKIRSVLAVM